MSRVALALFATVGLVACGVGLDIPQGAVVVCAADKECPEDTVCATALGECVNVALRSANGPRLQSATATAIDTVVLVFDVPVVASDAALAATTLEPPLLITAITADPADRSRLIVNTAIQRGQQPYTLEVGGVTDAFGQPIAADAKSILFNGFGPAPDGAPPSFILPLEGQQFPLGEVNIVWTGLALVEAYHLEVWTVDPNSVDPGEPSATYSTLAPTTDVAITLVDATTHWLRLRSDATRPGEYAVRRIEAIGDTLYVYCPAGESCDDTSTGGNLSSPRRSVARALIDSQALGATRVLIASRGLLDGGAEPEVYAESFDVYADLLVRGGYDPSFEETAWSPSAHRTIIRSTEATVMRCTSVKAASEGPLVVEGLEIVSASADPSSVVSFVNCDDGIELRNNVIANEGSNASRIGVFMQSSQPQGSPGPNLTGNLIRSGLGVQVVGVNTTIADNTFLAGGIPEAGGVFVTGGLVDIVNNTIQIDNSSDTGGWVAVYVLQLNPFTGRVRVLDNSIDVADSTRASDGVIFLNTDGEISGNTITTGDAPFSVGILVDSTEKINRVRDWSVTDNILDIGQGLGTYATSAAIFVDDRGDPIIATFARNRGVVAGLDDGGVTAGIFVGSENLTRFPSELTFANNVFDVGPRGNGVGAGSYTYLIGAKPKLTMIHNTFRWAGTTASTGVPLAGGVLVFGFGIQNIDLMLVNNLFVGPGTSTGGPAIYSEETAPAAILNNNLAVGVSSFARFPNRSAGVVSDATGTQCNTLFGDANLGPTGGILEASDLNLGGADGPLQPSATSPVELVDGGINTLLSFCGPADDAFCGGVGDDVLSEGRTCVGSECVSIGAYELD